MRLEWREKEEHNYREAQCVIDKMDRVILFFKNNGFDSTN